MVKLVKKICIFISCLLLSFCCLLGFKSFAYYEDSNGNLVSNNLFNQDEYTINPYNWVIQANDLDYQITQEHQQYFLRLEWNGTSQVGSNSACDIQVYNGATRIYYQTPNALGHNVYNIYLTDDITSFFIWSNVYLSDIKIAIYYENYNDDKGFEPYGIWYSQTNYDLKEQEGFNSGFLDGQNKVYDSLSRFYLGDYAIRSIKIERYNRAQGSNHIWEDYSEGLQYTLYSNRVVLNHLPNGGGAYSYRISFIFDNIYYLGNVGFSNDQLSGNQFVRPMPYDTTEVDTWYNTIPYSEQEYQGDDYFVYENVFNYIGGSCSAISFMTSGIGDLYQVGYTQTIFFEAINKDMIETSDSYQKGYTDATNNAQRTINTLTDEIKNLQQVKNNNFGWQSMFLGLADVPFRTVFNLLGFDLLGINLFTCFVGFITILGILWIFKRLIK